MTQSLIHDLLIILTAGLLAALACRWLRCSVLIGYLVVGALLGHGGLGWIADHDHQLEHFAEAGVFLLLFSIGVEFSLDDLSRMGGKFVLGGITQMTLVGVPISLLLCGIGMAWEPAVLIASALTFSSTVLVFKALSESGQSRTTHGRRAFAILLFQDAALVPLLLLVPLLTGVDGAPGLRDYVTLTATSIAFICVITLLRTALSQWIIPFFAGYRSPELIILFTIVSLAGVTFSAHSVGLPPAVGAFAAGLIFNGNRWTHQIDALVLPFRETFAAVFFIGLGLIFDPRLYGVEPLTIFGSLFGVLLLKAAAAAVALRLTGLEFWHAVGMGLGLAQVGEFAFVLVLLGLKSEVLDEIEYQRVVAVAVGSLLLTPPLMQAGLRLCSLSKSTEELVIDASPSPTANERATIIGAGPIGGRLTSQLETMGKEVCLIDLSPINLQPYAQAGFHTVVGDASDGQILRLAGVSDCPLCIVCVPQDGTAVKIVREIRRINQTTKLIVRCRYQASVTKLQRLGADHIVIEETEATLALLRALSRFDLAD
ncbi:cation:proton antiporter domain-containing protein [Rhodopirellula sallentina]|uniref:Sodium/hydrogen exchanger n=1 Tax=Rhodopirellula sallentina SM41 TaxID=1263870 RepID=M5UB85_9BACT|nr:cation:proton antiporter [Rhodopirellula sallentina]EMI53248.1 Sodium/hydrogen exchanger [Rhodopirellula sallentina SM41]